MAFSLFGYEIQLELKDSSNRSFRKVYLCKPSIDTEAEAQAAADGVLGTVPDVSGLTIKSYRVAKIMNEGAFTLPTGKNGSEQAQIVANLSGELETVNTFIPAPLDALFVAETGPNRNVIDVTNAALLAYLAHFKASGIFMISDGENLDESSPLLRGERITKSYNPK